jgi:hypothetical protein
MAAHHPRTVRALDGELHRRGDQARLSLAASLGVVLTLSALLWAAIYMAIKLLLRWQPDPVGPIRPLFNFHALAISA